MDTEATKTPEQSKSTPVLKEPIAIIGLACRLPGARDDDALWDLMISGARAWGPAADDRVFRQLYLDRGPQRTARTYTDLAGLMPDPEAERTEYAFDEDVFGRYDVAHRIFLQEACRALQDAGIDPRSIPRGRRFGVYVGHTGGSGRIGDLVYSTGIGEASELLQRTSASARLGADAARRLASELTDRVRTRYGARNSERMEALGAADCARIVREALGLDGPAAVLDAACASGLQALAVAVRALRSGRIDHAIVGAASHFKVDSLVLFSAAQSVSRTGSFPLCRDADGLVTSEGQVALVLKPFSAALRDGDRIRAVIDGIGMSSDGRGKSLWAPRSDGQILAMRRAYSDPEQIRTIGYVEAHATGTQVGDATELEALDTLLRPHLTAGERVAIGSLKTNIGHTLETAGLASLVKVVLAMERGTIPPGVSDRALNPALLDSDLLVAAQTAAPWPEKMPDGARRGAVNAFGIGGINVHLVVSRGATPLGASEAASIPNRRMRIAASDCILPGSRDKSEFSARRARGETALIDVPPSRWSAERASGSWPYRPFTSMLKKGGFLKDYAFDWRKFRIPPRQIASANPLQFMIIEAVDRALRSAGPVNPKSTAVIVGTGFGGDFSNELQIGLRLPETCAVLRPLLTEAGLDGSAADTVLHEYQDVLLERYPALLDETGSFTASSLATRVSKVFNFTGGAFALDAGRHSTAVALAAAQDVLSEEACETVVCAFAQRQMDLFAFEGLSLELSRPGEETGPTQIVAASDSFAPGEGVVVLILKRADASTTDPIIGRVRTEAASDVTAITAPAKAVQPLIGNLGAADPSVAILQSAEEPTATVHIAENGMRSEILLERAAGLRKSRTAALFPGQGSQYENCFRSMVARSKTAAAVMDDIDMLADCLRLPTLAETAWRPDHAMGRSAWDTQWAVFLSDLFAWRLLQRIGVEPDCLACHSFGEFPMAVASGVASFRQGASLVRARAEALETHGGADGGLLSMLVDETEARAVVSEAGDDLWVSAVNALRQTVVGGTLDALDRLEAICSDRRIACKRLAVGSAFHTPLLARAASVFAQAVETADFDEPAYPLFSATVGGPVPDSAALRDNLVAQFTEPVLWVATVKRLYDEGVRTFIEVGPSSTLSTLVRQILKDAPDVTVIPMDQRVQDDSSDPVELLRERFAAAGLVTAGSTSRRPDKRPRGDIERFDASVMRRTRNRERSLAVASPSSGRPSRPDPSPAVSRPSAEPKPPNRLKESITEFVMEHTGYPLDMIDFGLDLEADLGIDSIRKAQLIAELGRRFGIKRETGIALSDFLTLGDIETFFAQKLEQATDTEAASAVGHGSGGSGGSERPCFDLVVAAERSDDVPGFLLSFDRSIATEFATGTSGASQYWAIRENGKTVACWNEEGLFLTEARSFKNPGHGFRKIRVGAHEKLENLLGASARLDDIATMGPDEGRDILACDPSERPGLIMSWGHEGPGTAAARLGEDEFVADWGRLVSSLLTDDADGQETRLQLSAAGRWLSFGLVDGVLKMAAGDGLDPDWSKPIAVVDNASAIDADAQEPRTLRYALRLLEAPDSPATGDFGLGGSAAVLGEGPIAAALSHALKPPYDATVQNVGMAADGPDTVILADPAFLSQDPTSPFEDDDEALPRLISRLQAWLAPLERGEAVRRRLLALVDLGGDFGLSGVRLNRRAAALLGLLKGLSQEYPGSWIRAVDIGGIVWNDVSAARVIAELDEGSDHCEVALTEGGRKVVGLDRRPVPSSSAEEPPRGVWLATGGASGITAECMFALARRHRMKVALVGLTALEDPIEGLQGAAADKRTERRRADIARLSARYEAEGLEARYFACDLGDPGAVARLIEDVERLCGPIEALLHGAGAEESARFSKKTPKSFRSALMPKTRALDLLTAALNARRQSPPLRMLVAFGSTSGQFGGHGQADYSMANQLLARQVAALRRETPGLKASCFHWHAWADTGMAARSGIQILLEGFGIGLMPVAEGIAHFLSEIEAGLPEAEVVVTEPDLVAANRRRLPLHRTDADTEDRLRHAAAGATTVQVRLDPANQPFLRDHRLGGVPLLPAAMAVELLLQASSERVPEFPHPVLSDFVISRPVKVPFGRETTLVIDRPALGEVLTLREMQEQDVSVTGTVRWGPEGCAPCFSPEPAPFPLYPSVYFDDAELIHGPLLRTLKGSYFERDGGWSELEAPDPSLIMGSHAAAAIRSPVALVDGCFYACGMFAYFLCGRRVERPLAIRRMTIGRAPHKGEICTMRFGLVEQKPTYSLYDFSLFDAEGAALLDVRGLRMGRFS